MKKLASLLVCSALVGCHVAFSQDPAAQAISPDGRNVISLWSDPVAYTVARDGVTLVEKTQIDLEIDGQSLCTGVKLRDVATSRITGSLGTPVYKKASIDLSANETYADFGDWGVRLAARNDGVAYRFETRKGGRVTVSNERAGVTIPSADAEALVYRTSRPGCEGNVPVCQKAGSIETIEGSKREAMVYLPLVYSMKQWQSLSLMFLTIQSGT